MGVCTLKEKLSKATPEDKQEIDIQESSSSSVAPPFRIEDYNPTRHDFIPANVKKLEQQYRDLYQALTHTAQEKRLVEDRFRAFQNDIKVASEASGDDRELIARLLYQNREVY